MTAVLHRESTDAIYLEVDGERWRVHDCALLKGGLKRLPTPSSRAKYRVFVAADGRRRAHLFTWREIREITASKLEVQFRRAGYLGTKNGEPTSQWVQPRQRDS